MIKKIASKKQEGWNKNDAVATTINFDCPIRFLRQDISAKQNMDWMK